MLATTRTKQVSVGAAICVAGAVVLSGPWFPGDFALASGAGALVALPLGCAGVCLWAALQLTAPRMRTQWILFGSAAVLFATGQFLEEFGGQDVAGFTVAKALFLLAIVAYGVGAGNALRSFAGFLNVRRAVQLSAALAATISVLGASAVTRLVSGLGAPLADKIVLAIYPLGVLWLMAVPAFALALTVSQMGGGMLARPWWAVFAGVTLIALSNVVLMIAVAVGTPLTNAGPAEYGWWMGMGAIAVGAAMQADYHRPKRTVAE